MKGILIFDVNCGPGSFLGHSQKWYVNLPTERFHVESWIRKGVLIPDTPRKITITPCDDSCFKNNIPNEVVEKINRNIPLIQQE